MDIHSILTAEILHKAFAFGGENRQITLLENEGVKVDGNRVDLEKYRWNRVTIEMMEKTS